MKEFVIAGDTWTEEDLVKVLTRQFKSLYPDRNLDCIEYEYEEDDDELLTHEEGLAIRHSHNLYFNVVADDTNFQVWINTEDSNIYWDKQL